MVRVAIQAGLAGLQRVGDGLPALQKAARASRDPVWPTRCSRSSARTVPYSRSPVSCSWPRVPAPRLAPANRHMPTVLREMAARLRYVHRSMLLADLLLCAFVFNLGAGALSVLEVVFVTRALHLRPEMAGVLLMANGLGGITGCLLIALASARVGHRYHWVLGWMVLANGLAYLAYALVPSLAEATVALVLVGLAFIPALMSYQPIVQLASVDAARGRVPSIFSTAVAPGEWWRRTPAQAC
jgi:predicted MFS family arabinose efflux permease